MIHHNKNVQPREVLFEKTLLLNQILLESLESLKLNHNADNIFENIFIFVNNLNKILCFKSEKRKNDLIYSLGTTIEHYFDDNNIEHTYMDSYGLNDVDLYSSFAKYYLTGEEPTHLFEDYYFGKNNKQEFKKFVNGKHKVLEIPK